MKIIIVIIFIIVCGIIGSSLKNSIDNDNKKNGILYHEYGAMFLGGLPNVEGGKKIDLTITERGFFIKFKGNNLLPIYSQDIVNAEIKTNQQINKEIGLGKLLVFGILAFGMKNSKTIIKNYVCVTYKNLSELRTIIIESNKNEELVNQLRCFVK